MDIKRIQILGPYNTGTNLLSQILRDNLKQNVNIHPEGHTLFWKHTIDRPFVINSIKSNKDTLFICTYKPIDNWICSMMKYNYDIRWNNELKDKCRFKGVEYENIIRLYNKFYNMYIGLINNFDNVISMSYYDIINKNTVVNYISNKLNKFGLNIKSENNIMSILDKPSKDHGNGVKSSNEAFRKKKDCHNKIYNNKENKLLIDSHLNHRINRFFEN